MQAQLPANDYQPSNIFFDNRQQVQITFSPTNPADSSYLLMINNFGMATLFKNNDIYAQPPALYPGDYFDLQFGKYADTDEKFLQIMELNSYGDKVL
jgi:hypothetical protein